MEYQKAAMRGTIIGTTLGYLHGYPQVTYARSSYQLNYVTFDGLALEVRIGQIVGTVIVIRDGPLLG